MNDVLDAEIVADQPGGELATMPSNLFHSNDPVVVLEQAVRTANALAPVIRNAKLVVSIQGRDYLTCEAWQTLGAQLGVTGVIASTTKLADGWEARCEARTLDGRVIGAADSMCLRDEVSGQWKDADEFAIRSMAQTRAMSRALSSVLRFVPTLAGFAGTPSEEVPPGGFQGGGRHGNIGTDTPSDGQMNFLASLLKRNDVAQETVDAILVWGAEHLTGGGKGTASRAIETLKEGTPEARTEAIEWLTSSATGPPPEDDPTNVTPEFDA